MINWYNILPFGLWAIWKNRNHKFFNNRAITPNWIQIYNETLKYITLVSPNKQVQGKVDIHLKWINPIQGSFMLNNDGACKGNLRKGGIGGDP